MKGRHRDHCICVSISPVYVCMCTLRVNEKRMTGKKRRRRRPGAKLDIDRLFRITRSSDTKRQERRRGKTEQEENECRDEDAQRKAEKANRHLSQESSSLTSCRPVGRFDVPAQNVDVAWGCMQCSFRTHAE